MAICQEEIANNFGNASRAGKGIAMSSGVPEHPRRLGRPQGDMTPLTDLARRLQELFPSPNLSKLAVEWDVSRETVRNYLVGKTAPPPELLAGIAEATGCSEAWLLSGSAKSPRRRTMVAAEPSRRAPLRHVALPVLGLAAADVTRGERVIDASEEQEPYELPTSRALVQVVGSSMQPLARDGQYVMVAGAERSAKSGDLVVVWTRSKGTLFKRVHIRGRGRVDRRYVLLPVNPLQDAEPVELGERDVRDMRVIVGVLYE